MDYLVLTARATCSIPGDKRARKEEINWKNHSSWNGIGRLIYQEYVQRETAVTDYLKSKPLQLFALGNSKKIKNSKCLLEIET